MSIRIGNKPRDPDAVMLKPHRSWSRKPKTFTPADPPSLP
jgi:hypothetical protein